MDSALRGIEATRPSCHPAGTAQPASRDGSISLDGRSPLEARFPDIFVPVPHRRPTSAIPFDPAKSPLLPMAPLELSVVDKPRDASPAVGCPLLPSSPSPSPSSSSCVLPLNAYLMDENDHERRLLRLAGNPSMTAVQHANRGRTDWSDPDVEAVASLQWAADSPFDAAAPSSWAYMEPERDGTQDTAGEPSTGRKRGLDAAAVAADLAPHRRRKLQHPESATTPQARATSVSTEAHDDDVVVFPVSAASRSSSSPSAPDSGMTDPVVAVTPLAARHLRLHRLLLEAGLGGLVDNANSVLRYHRAGDAPGGARVQRPPRVIKRRPCKDESWSTD